MKNKVNMKDMQLLLPDYISGSLNVEETRIIEDAIKSNTEISEMYNEMKSAFKFVESVKSEEPVPQYWNNLLPRIHERMEARKEKKLFNKPVPVLWKVLVPIAAVILIALIYRVAFISEKQYTEKKENIIQPQPEKEQKQVNPQIIENESKEEAENIEKEPNTERVPRNHFKVNKKEHPEKEILISENENLANENNNDIIDQNEKKLIDEFASVDINALTYVTGPEIEEQSEELEHEVEKLSSNEKEDLLKDISNLNM